MGSICGAENECPFFFSAFTFLEYICSFLLFPVSFLLYSGFYQVIFDFFLVWGILKMSGNNCT